ncbi:glycosyltransferase family 2 protein [Candidatus Woesearchaeota archaeon]|nr:glycosyltransferase family 2 protein [Candidatus Woesearchaeota archaeon]
MKISLVLPAHNEEENIVILIPKVLGKYKKFFNEIIIVNDNSTDNTKDAALKLIKKYGKKIRLVNRSKPNGVGYALRDGIKNVGKSSDWVMTMDADFLDNVDDIERFIEKAKEGYDGVIGSRFLDSNSLVKYPFIKKISNRAYHFLLRATIPSLKLKDATNNFKLYKKEVFDSVNIKAGNFAANAETGLIPIIKGYKIVEIPVVWKQREHGKSTFKVFKLAPSYLKVYLRIIFEMLKAKLRV